ncbi:hypothetical protein [Paenibacillus sp. FSL K6-0108]|uniref:hypothetical protein n=1 Tax=Paenibacillus sp. FSL K6-0108 TaxID=2921417 RepID=UPI0032495B61
MHVAYLGFKRWLEEGETIEHPAVRSTLKTMRNWQEEIVDYHHLSFYECDSGRKA